MRDITRLLSSLPGASRVDAFISRHVQSGVLRALCATPQLACTRTEPYTPVRAYRVVHKRVAVRQTPHPDGFIDGAKQQGDVVNAIELSADGQWIRFDERKWLMIRHKDLGELLEKLDTEDDD